MTATAYDLVTRKVEEATGYRARGAGSWRCPAHDDNSPSLSISNGTGDGKVVLQCHAGCATDDVLKAAGLTFSDLFDEQRERIERPAHGLGRAVATYPYTDELGELLFEVVRYEPKTFRQRRPDGRGGWINNAQGVTKPLYRLPAVRAAVAEGRTVFVVEGEKDVEALELVGETATCNPMGAGKWRDHHTEALAGAAEVVIVRDKDAEGIKHAATVEAALIGKVGHLVIAEAKIGKDVAEHLGAGLTVDELEVVEVGDGSDEVGPVTPVDVSSSIEQQSDLFRTWTPAELLASDRTFEWLIRGLLVDPTYGMLAGAKKSLKSYIGMFVDLGLVTGTSIFGHFAVPRPRPVIAYVGEGGRVPFIRRLERIAAAMKINLDDVPMLLSFDVAPLTSDVFRESLQRDLAAFDEPGLVHIDPYYAFHGSNTDSRNLHEEGTLLTSVSAPVVDAGWSLMVTNHFKSTGSGQFDLDNITQAGGAEWSDSWLMVRHREEPKVDEGSFRLLLDVGSRQWGGTTWELDFEVGRFDVETAEFDGQISWEVRRHSGSGGIGKDEKARGRILEVVEDHPWEMTKTAIKTTVGGNKDSFDRAWKSLEDSGKLLSRQVRMAENGREVARTRWGLLSTLPDDLAPVGPGWDRYR